MCPDAQFNVTLNTTTLNDSQEIHTLAHSAISRALYFLPFQHLLPSFLLCLPLRHFLEPDFPPRPTTRLKWTIWQSDAMGRNITQAGTNVHYAMENSPGKFLRGATTECRANCTTWRHTLPQLLTFIGTNVDSLVILSVWASIRMGQNGIEVTEFMVVNMVFYLFHLPLTVKRPH